MGVPQEAIARTPIAAKRGSDSFRSIFDILRPASCATPARGNEPGRYDIDSFELIDVTERTMTNLPRSSLGRGLHTASLAVGVVNA